MSKLRKWTVIPVFGIVLFVWIAFFYKNMDNSNIPVPPHLTLQLMEDHLEPMRPPEFSFVGADVRQTAAQVLPKSIYEERKKLLKNVCEGSNELRHDMLENQTYYDRDHRIFYCKIQKVGSTFLGNMMFKLRGMENITTYNEKKRLGKIAFGGDIHQLYNTIRGSFKFLFVRDPYARAVSGYIDKLYAPNPIFWSRVGMYAVQTFRKNATELSKRCGHNLSFPEFVRYLIHSQKTGERRNPHFFPMYEHCSPCQIKYDFVGKLETFKNDVLFLFNQWNTKFGTNITFADFQKESDMFLAKNQVNRLYLFRRTLRRCMTFYQGMCRVWYLLQARGIIPKSVDIPISRKKASSISQEEMQKVVYQAIKSGTDRKAVKDQREQAVVAAYKMVPKKDLDALAEIFRPDCELFGYDPLPSKIFSFTSNTSSKRFPFLDIM